MLDNKVQDTQGLRRIRRAKERRRQQKQKQTGTLKAKEAEKETRLNGYSHDSSVSKVSAREKSGA